MKSSTFKNDIRCRFTNALYNSATDHVFAIDDKGLLYKLTANLEPITTSDATSHGIVLHGLCDDTDYVYTRDVAGNIVKWDKQTLHVNSSGGYLEKDHEMPLRIITSIS